MREWHVNVPNDIEASRNIEVPTGVGAWRDIAVSGDIAVSVRC